VIRLGGHGLTAEGRPIEKHRIFDIARVEGVRRLHDELLTDVRDVPLPPDGRGPWEVRARWLFRRAPPVFSRWALDREDAEMPVWELAGTRFVVEAS
jgi:hypothetical protein